MDSDNGQMVYRVGLAGNPNSGKTSIFNALTGARRRVGNYPGVTVEKLEGSFRIGETTFELVDLPGTYSLTSYSPEERIAQDELLRGDFDIVIVVVDSTTLRRGLVLLAQVMEIGANPVLCLNMADEAKKAGQHIDVAQMRTLLGFSVVETIGNRRKGVDALREAITESVKAPVQANKRLVLGKRLQRALDEVEAHLAGTRFDNPTRTWVAHKLLVEDLVHLEAVRGVEGAGQRAIDEANQQRSKIEAETNQDISLFSMERYYGFVDGLLREVMVRRSRENARALSDAIDSVLVNRVVGLPVFLLMMYGIFWMTFELGDYPMGWIESGFSALGEWITGIWPAESDSVLRSLLVDGIIAGVGGVIVFLPNIVLLFLGLALLEDTGYMGRAAFLMDRMMHRFGLHGQSFLPLMTGFGCSIPGVMATRTLANEHDRLTTMLVLPLMSCGARLPIWMLLIPAFFPQPWRAPMLWVIYSIGVILALLLALLLRKSVLKSEEAPFVMELPPYRLPTLRAVLLKMVERSWVYLRKAGTIILGISIIMWVLTAFPRPDEYAIDRAIESGAVQVVDAESRASGDPDPNLLTVEQVEARRSAEDLHASIAGHIGRFLEPLVRPMGFDWKIATALLGAFAAKEVFVSQMGIVYSMGGADEPTDDLRTRLQQDYTTTIGFSLMLFLLIASPCMATIAITRRESGSWKWAFLQWGGLTALAYVLATAFYQISRLFT